MRTIRTTSLMLAALVMVLAAVPAAAGPRSRRSGIQTATYSSPAGVWAFSGNLGAGVLTTDCSAGQGCVQFAVPTGASSVVVEVTDSSGLQPVALVSGVTEEGGLETCQSNTGPLTIAPTSTPEEEAAGDDPVMISVTLASGICSDGTPALATSGTVTATFTNEPAQ